MADQKPKQSETHSSTFPQDSDSDSESEIELRSSHSSPEETTSDESDGTLVETSTPSSPTHPLSGEGDLDPTEGHSQLSVGTLPLTNKDPPENSEDKSPPQEPPVEGLAPGSSENNTRDKKSGNIPPTEKSKQVVDSPFEYPPQDQPETPIDSGEVLEEPSSKRPQKVPIDDPFSRFWSGETGDTLNKDKRDIDGWLGSQKGDTHLNLRY